MHDTPLEDCIEPTSLRNLFAVPATIDLAGAEIELVPAFSRELKLRRALEPALDEFEFVLIDCPPSLGLITVNGLAAAGEVVVPIQCEYYALEGLGQLLKNVNLVKANLNPGLEVSAIILTMYDRRTKLAEQVASEVRAHFGAKVCRNIVPRTVRLSEAPSFGQPIIVFDPSSRGAIAYRELARRSGLGKGLGALIPTDVVVERGSDLLEIPLTAVHASSRQPRQHFDEESLASLTASVRELGILQPVLVRRLGDSYQLIAGERRFRAAKRAGLASIPAIVREADDATSLEHALVENLHREDLNPLEEAAGYQQLIEEFQLTHEQVAARVGRSRAAISNTLRLFQLPPTVQRLVAENQLSAGHARALLGTPDRAFQETMARRAVADGLSVRAVEDAVREHLSLAAANEATEATEQSADARQARSSRLRPPGLLELEELLSEHLSTRVKVQMGPKRGRVVVEFATLEDLERIYRAMTASTVSR